jgi:ADP-ribose pyrophosphatase YjhB (NUDIX family)
VAADEREPGWCELVEVARGSEPAAWHEMAWDGGRMPLRVSAYTTTPDLPIELVTSVRCIVRVGGLVVFCRNADGRHPWPGGRRRAAESYADTAAREVHEETGWLIERSSLRQLGWLHLTHLGGRPSSHQGPYPDFLQVVFTATASDRDGGVDAPWTDTDGYELSSELLTLDEALVRTSTDLLAPVFLELLRRQEQPDRA